MTCFKKNQGYLGDSDGVGDMRHHRMPHDNRRPRCSNKVGMRYFHHPRNKFHCPTIGADRFWSLGPDDIKDPTTACDDSSALLTGVTPSCYFKILRQNAFTGYPRY